MQFDEKDDDKLVETELCFVHSFNAIVIVIAYQLKSIYGFRLFVETRHIILGNGAFYNHKTYILDYI